jgi:hypothetical protein
MNSARKHVKAAKGGAQPRDSPRATCERCVLVASPAALPLRLALSAEVHGDQKGDRDRQEDSVDPVAAREIPKSYAGLDRSDNTEHAILQ